MGASTEAAAPAATRAAPLRMNRRRPSMSSLRVLDGADSEAGDEAIEEEIVASWCALGARRRRSRGSGTSRISQVYATSGDVLSLPLVSSPDAAFFEDLKVGQEYTSPGRTVTETDVMIFAGLSGDYNVLHTDAEHMKGSLFGERIAHRLLGRSEPGVLRGRGAQRTSGDARDDDHRGTRDPVHGRDPGREPSRRRACARSPAALYLVRARVARAASPARRPGLHGVRMALPPASARRRHDTEHLGHEDEALPA